MGAPSALTSCWALRSQLRGGELPIEKLQTVSVWTVIEDGIEYHISGTRAGVAGTYNRSELLPERKAGWADYKGPEVAAAFTLVGNGDALHRNGRMSANATPRAALNVDAMVSGRRRRSRQVLTIG
jgi:hypothetical protein